MEKEIITCADCFHMVRTVYDIVQLVYSVTDGRFPAI